MRWLCGFTLAELGQRLGGLDYAAVGMALRRQDARLPQDPRLRRIYDQAADKLHVKTCPFDPWNWILMLLDLPTIIVGIGGLLTSA